MIEYTNRYNLLFMGSSGSGKDTQAGLMKEFLERRDGIDSVLYVYTGDVLRDLAKQETYIAKLVHKIAVKEGGKVPDLLAAWGIGEVLVSKMKESHHLIFSSSPRSVVEVQLLNEIFNALGRKNIFYVYLNIPREEAARRLLSRGRQDDNTSTINNRLDFYERYVVPALEYCRRKSPHGLIEIDGSPHDQEKIHHEILKVIGLR